jgi:NAD(P)-dependent dehydrogenase (short-subunit alcohol dehydrogenase family)
MMHPKRFRTRSSSSPAPPRASAAAWRWRRRAKARGWCWPTAPLVRSGAEAQALGAIVTLASPTSRPGPARPLMETALREFGRIDVLVNNVGGTIWAKPYQEYERSRSRPRSAARCSRPCGAAAPCCPR